MVVLTSFTHPTDGIRHRQPHTTVFVNDDNLGKGTLYIAESRLSWISDSGNGFSLEYPHISLHAISRDLTAFPQECLFLMLDTALGDEENIEENGDENNENGTDEQGTTELRLVPDDRGMLDAMFHAMNACQALHPDPEDSFSDEDLYEDADDEVPMEETDSRMASLRIENMDGRGYMGVGMEAEEEGMVGALASGTLCMAGVRVGEAVEAAEDTAYTHIYTEEEEEEEEDMEGDKEEDIAGVAVGGTEEDIAGVVVGGTEEDIVGVAEEGTEVDIGGVEGRDIAEVAEEDFEGGAGLGIVGARISPYKKDI